MVAGEVTLESKIDKLGKLIEIFDEMSKDLNFGRLSNSEKDVLLNISRQYSSKNNKKLILKKLILLIMKVNQLLNQRSIKF